MKYLSFRYPSYIYLQIIPSTSIRNYNSDNILRLIASCYRSFSQQIKRINNTFCIESTAKISFYIYFEKNRVDFYFIVPETHYLLFKDKINDTWSNKIDIQEVSELPLINKGTGYYMTYRYEDAMSLVTDKRNNTLISSELNTLYQMQEGDKAGIIFNFIPTDQKSWIVKYDKTIQKLKDDLPINKQKLTSISYYAYLLLSFIIRALNILLASFSIDTTQVKNKYELRLTEDTIKKRTSVVIDSQIVCLSESEDKLREINIAQALCNSFNHIASDDNELVAKKLKVSKVNILDTKIKGAEINKITPREGQNFISLPAREQLEEHKAIARISVRQSHVPNVLRKGIIPLGINEYKDEKDVPAYLPTLKRERCKALVVIGATRNGKSTFLSNVAYYARKGGECTIIFDFCADCKLSEEINEVIDNVHNIDCSDFNNLQGMGYNEVRQDATNSLEQYDNAKIQTNQLLALIDSVNADDRELKAKMNRLLTAASLVVFLNSGSINDVLGVLEDHVARNEYIKKIPEPLYRYTGRHVNTLRELDEVKNGVVVGTKYNLIAGIMDRFEELKKNTYMELMLMKDCKNNFNLIDEMQKNQIICFRMPETMFTTQTEKDVYCTYWMTKIWLAVKFRNKYIPENKQVKVNLIIDELYQVPKCQDYLRKILSQMAKFNLKTIISAHYMNSIHIIREELKSANSSYMLLAGCDEANYKELSDKLSPYTVDDLLHLKEFQSLNAIRLGDGYEVFVTDLPKPLWWKNRKEFEVIGKKNGKE